MKKVPEKSDLPGSPKSPAADASMKSTKGSRRREQLIAALLSQPTMEKAAASIGISVSTAYRIRKTQAFQEEYLRVRRELVLQAGARLQQGAGAASAVLLQTMVDRNTPPTCRVRASDRVLYHATKLVELEDQEVRLQRVEHLVAERLGTGKAPSL